MLKNSEIVSVIPAPAGYEVHLIDGREFCGAYPVIAFVVVKTTRKDESFFLSTYPMTCESEGFMGDDNVQNYALRYPDGRFDFYDQMADSKEKAEELLRA